MTAHQKQKLTNCSTMTNKYWENLMIELPKMSSFEKREIFKSVSA